MSKVALWLSELGLEKYVSAFEEAEIEFADLVHLTDDDLKEVGLPVGPRRRVNEAIKNLIAGSVLHIQDPQVIASKQSDINGSPSVSSPDAERRHLTVMFVDLIGSTEMASKIDPEDMRSVITNYQNTIAGIVTRYEGFVAKFMGDGVLCYFGWPRANEDDAERAVRAGLAMIAAIKEERSPNGDFLATRVGIATGVVIVGDLIGSGATQEAAVVGETPNLAARLQGLALPNQLVLPKETQSLLGDIFELESMGPHNLKGIAEPVDAFAVIGEKTQESRFAARQMGMLTPIIGREQELVLMHECWVKAKAANGQMIVVSGEAGIGKSRITQAAIDGIAKDEHTRITYQCSPYHTDSAFHPIIQQMGFAAGFQVTDGVEARLDKLEILIGSDQQSASLIAALLGIDASERYGVLDLTPAQIRTRTMQTLVGLMVQQAESKPLLMVFEDLHWIDPTTLELLDLALDAITDRKILLLATARPTFEHGFGGHPIVTRFALNRLGKEQILSIVGKLTDDKTLPEEVLKIIADRTDGVPLFVEELTKTILESGVLKEDGSRLVLDGPLDMLAIPNTLHDSLMARLDRLQPIKEVAQTAACIGREFEHQLLANISSISATELNAALEGLIKAELIYRRGLPPEATYLFKHALVRDAAYESLLREKRRAVHTRILAVLEKTLDIAPEVLAYHAETAGQTDRAIDLWEVASKAAIARPAFDEGISHLRHAIALAFPEMETGGHPALERALQLQTQLAPLLLARYGYAADQTTKAYQTALTLTDKIGETPLRFSALYGLWVGKYMIGKHVDALASAEEMLIEADKTQVKASKMIAARLAGSSSCMKGRLGDAIKHIDHALDLYDPDEHRGHEGRFGQEPGISARNYKVLSLWGLGQTRQAEAMYATLEHDALETNHVPSIVYMHSHLGIAASLAQNDDATFHHAKMLGKLGAKYNLDQMEAYAAILNSFLRIKAGDPTAITDYLEADKKYANLNARLYTPMFRTTAGWNALAIGHVKESRKLASMAREMIDLTGEDFSLSDLHRLEAALAMADGNKDVAERSLNLAIEIAREQGAKSWELRAAIDLARLLDEAGQTEDAIAILNPICGSIAEGDCLEDRATAQDMLNSFAM